MILEGIGFDPDEKRLGLLMKRSLIIQSLGPQAFDWVPGSLVQDGDYSDRWIVAAKLPQIFRHADEISALVFNFMVLRNGPFTKLAQLKYSGRPHQWPA